MELYAKRDRNSGRAGSDTAFGSGIEAARKLSRRLSFLPGPFSIDEGLNALSMGCPRLLELRFCGRGIVEASADVLVAAVRRWPCLQRLDLSYSNRGFVNDNFLQHVGEFCPRIQALKLADCSGVSDSGLVSFVMKSNRGHQGGSCCLRELCVDRCRYGPCFRRGSESFFLSALAS